ICLLSDRNKYSNVRIYPVQTPQGQPCADLSGMPNPNESFVNVIPPQIGKIYVVDQILVDIIHKYSSLLVYCRKNPCYLLCNRRSNNPSLKRPDIPVAPE